MVAKFQSDSTSVIPILHWPDSQKFGSAFPGFCCFLPPPLLDLRKSRPGRRDREFPRRSRAAGSLPFFLAPFQKFGQLPGPVARISRNIPEKRQGCDLPRFRRNLGPAAHLLRSGKGVAEMVEFEREPPVCKVPRHSCKCFLILYPGNSDAWLGFPTETRAEMSS